MEEQKCIGSLGICGCSPQTVQNQFNPAQNTGKREGARRMGPTTDSTVSGHLRGLLTEKGPPAVQPQAETLLQPGALQRIQPPF